MEDSRARDAMTRIALVGMLIAIGAAACGSSGGAAGPPSNTGLTQVSPVPTTVSPSPSATAASPVDGTWQTAHLSESDMENAYVAAGGTAKAARAFWLGNGAGTTYVVITIKLLGGTFSGFSSSNGEPAQQINSATYEL